jgi:hypothetical protein
MTNNSKFNILQRLVETGLDKEYERNTLSHAELNAIEVFWGDAVTLVEDSINDGYFEED